MSGTRPPIEGLPKQQEWKVLAVREGAEEPGQKGGTLKKFYVDFEGCDDVYWRRKMPAQVEVGQTYFGTISNGDYGPIFKKESPGGAGGGHGGGGGDASRGGGRTFKPESEFDPEKVARMGRAHAQGMALTWLEAIGDMPNDLAELWPYVDAFEADVNAAGAKAKAAAPAPAPAAAEPAPPAEPEPVDETTIRNLCEHAGLDQAPAERLTRFVSGRLKPEQQQRAKTGLEREAADTLQQLSSAFEQAEGFPLKEEDDIPF
jgi:hypothetical protein